MTSTQRTRSRATRSAFGLFGSLYRLTALFPDIKSTSADSLFLAEGRDRLPKRGGMLVAGPAAVWAGLFLLAMALLAPAHVFHDERSGVIVIWRSLTSSFISVRPSLAGFGAIRSELSGITCFNAPFGWSRGNDGDGQLAPSTSRLVTGL